MVACVNLVAGRTKMSSTNRTNSKDRHIADYYATPQKPIFDLFNAMRDHWATCALFNAEDNNFREENVFFDPCAGGNLDNDISEYTPMAYPYAISKFGTNKIYTNDIRPDSLAVSKKDYLQMPTVYGRSHIIITNPPFDQAQEIITKALNECFEGGFVIMLLRLNFFGAAKRKSFWKNNMPVVTFVHSDRIGFKSNYKDPKERRGTDSIEYMHCVWKVGVKQDHTELILI